MAILISTKPFHNFGFISFQLIVQIFFLKCVLTECLLLHYCVYYLQLLFYLIFNSFYE